MRKLTVSDRLQKMEDNQQEFAKAIERINAQLDKQDIKMDFQSKQLDILNSKFDQLSGGKQALMWVTGVSIAIAGLVITFINANKH